MDRGTLIILNGGSSAGKTSLGKCLQDMLDETYLLLGIDAFWFSLPPKQLDLERVEPRYYSWEATVEGGLEYFRIIPGPLLDKVMRARYKAIAAFLDAGMNVIADDVIWKRQWLLDALELLAAYRVFVVGVYVSDPEGARREELRGDRHPGWDRGSARYAHRDVTYDLKVDTTHESPELAARTIKAAWDSGLEPMAFEQMRRKYS